MKKGFTLFEMLVVLAIVGMLTVSMLLNRGQTETRAQLFNAAKEIALAVREVEGLTMTTLEEGASIPCGFGVFFQYSSQDSLNAYTASHKIFYENTTESDCFGNVDMIYGSVLGNEVETDKITKDFNSQGVVISDIKAGGVSVFNNPGGDLFTSEVSLFFVPPEPIIYIDGDASSVNFPLEIVVGMKGVNCRTGFDNDKCKIVRINQLGYVSID
ncbi:type II secretion system protein [bacterium]|nr:MAG: type II secretion system protein [bacterium]